MVSRLATASSRTVESTARRRLPASTPHLATPCATASRIRSGRLLAARRVRQYMNVKGRSATASIAKPHAGFHRRSNVNASTATRSDRLCNVCSTNAEAITEAGNDGRPRTVGNKSSNGSSGNNRDRCRAWNQNTLPSASRCPADDSTSRARAAHPQDPALTSHPELATAAATMRGAAAGFFSSLLALVALEQSRQVRTVSRLDEGLCSRLEFSVRQEAPPPRDLLRATDLEALAMLDRPHVVGGLQQRVERSRVEPSSPPWKNVDLQATLLEVDAVDVGDLVLAAGRRREVVRDGDDIVVVEVQTRNSEVALRLRRLLFERQGPSGGVELNGAVGAGIGDAVGEYGSAADVMEAFEPCPQTRSVEDVVAEDERHGVLADEVGSQDESLSQAVRLRLDRVADRDAELRAVSEKTVELGCVVRCCDDEDLADTCSDQRRQRVVDHRLVVHRD